MTYIARNIVLLIGICAIPFSSRGGPEDLDEVKAEHGQIGNITAESTLHSTHPEAQWFPEAGLGLFLHWGISSVRSMNISWPMIPGRKLAMKRISDPKEVARIMEEMDYGLDGKKPEITPLEYWTMADLFNPTNYHPEKWLQEAKDAGFTYVVLTTKHHEGFALWPSEFGNFNTKKVMGGRDLVKEYVEAARKVGLKVGLYYSGPDWYFDQNYMNFFYYKVAKLNPEFPQIGPDLKPRISQPDLVDVQRHQEEYANLVRGQVEELLTHYGKIDLLWFDGAPRVPNSRMVITQERIRELQPGIVINTRMHGKGDFITLERQLRDDPALAEGKWGEFCNPWNGTWSYVPKEFKDLNLVLTDLVRCRALGANYLLGIGPMADGDLASEAYKSIDNFSQWMKQFHEAIYATKRLSKEEKSSVPAVSKGDDRYLYIIPEKGGLQKNTDIVFQGAPARPASVTLLSDGQAVPHTLSDGVVTIHLPHDRASALVDVIRISFH